MKRVIVLCLLVLFLLGCTDYYDRLYAPAVFVAHEVHDNFEINFIYDKDTGKYFAVCYGWKWEVTPFKREATQ